MHLQPQYQLSINLGKTKQFCHKGNLNLSVRPSWSAVVIYHHHVLKFIYFVSLEKKSVSV